MQTPEFADDSGFVDLLCAARTVLGVLEGDGPPVDEGDEVDLPALEDACRALRAALERLDAGDADAARPTAAELRKWAQGVVAPRSAPWLDHRAVSTRFGGAWGALALRLEDLRAALSAQAATDDDRGALRKTAVAVWGSAEEALLGTQALSTREQRLRHNALDVMRELMKAPEAPWEIRKPAIRFARNVLLLPLDRDTEKLREAAGELVAVLARSDEGGLGAVLAKVEGPARAVREELSRLNGETGEGGTTRQQQLRDNVDNEDLRGVVHTADSFREPRATSSAAQRLEATVEPELATCSVHLGSHKGRARACALRMGHSGQHLTAEQVAEREAAAGDSCAALESDLVELGFGDELRSGDTLVDVAARVTGELVKLVRRWPGVSVADLCATADECASAVATAAAHSPALATAIAVPHNAFAHNPFSAAARALDAAARKAQDLRETLEQEREVSSALGKRLDELQRKPEPDGSSPVAVLVHASRRFEEECAGVKGGPGIAWLDAANRLHEDVRRVVDMLKLQEGDELVARGVMLLTSRLEWVRPIEAAAAFLREAHTEQRGAGGVFFDVTRAAERLRDALLEVVPVEAPRQGRFPRAEPGTCVYCLCSDDAPGPQWSGWTNASRTVCTLCAEAHSSVWSEAESIVELAPPDWSRTAQIVLQLVRSRLSYADAAVTLGRSLVALGHITAAELGVPAGHPVVLNRAIAETVANRVPEGFLELVLSVAASELGASSAIQGAAARGGQ